jgi:hypothetical protein
MDPLLVVLGAFVLVVVVLASPWARSGDGEAIDNSRRRDNEMHRRVAEAMSEVEAHDIDEMLEAINDRRRERGRPGIGEQLADDLIRSTWK